LDGLGVVEQHAAIDYKAKCEALKIEHGKCDAIIMSLKQETTITPAGACSLRCHHQPASQSSC